MQGFNSQQYNCDMLACSIFNIIRFTKDLTGLLVKAFNSHQNRDLTTDQTLVSGQNEYSVNRLILIDQYIAY